MRELIEAADEAHEAMIWILGGFDRTLSAEERGEALPRYHATIKRLRTALDASKRVQGEAGESAESVASTIANWLQGDDGWDERYWAVVRSHVYEAIQAHAERRERKAHAAGRAQGVREGMERAAALCSRLSHNAGTVCDLAPRDIARCLGMAKCADAIETELARLGEQEGP